MLIPITSQNSNNTDKNDKLLDEIEQKIKDKKAEIHEIDTSVTLPIEAMSEQSFFALCNPSVVAFKDGLAELNRLVSENSMKDTILEQFEVIDQIHMILLMGNEQLNMKIIEMLPELYSFLSNSELYDRICTVLSDISHMNSNVIRSLINYNIFEKLDYSRKSSFSLVFNICDKNKDGWNSFQSFMKPEFKHNQYITILNEQYK